MQAIEQEVRQFVIDNFMFGADASQLHNSDSFLDKGLVDSMGILSLVEFVSGKYGIEVADEELIPDNWDSIEKIASFVRSRSTQARSDAQLAAAAIV